MFTGAHGAEELQMGPFKGDPEVKKETAGIRRPDFSEQPHGSTPQDEPHPKNVGVVRVRATHTKQCRCTDRL